MEPVSKAFVSYGITLNYLDWGNEGAPLLLLLHGTSDHARSWDWTARALKHRFHVIALDLRGHGDSQWSPDGAYLVAYHVADLTDFIESLGQDRVTIVGHSFGGSVASRYAGLFPDRMHKLVLIDGFGPPPTSYAKWMEYGAVRRTRDWLGQRRILNVKPVRRLATLDDAIARIIAGNPRLSAAQSCHLAVHGVRQHPDGYSWKFDRRAAQFMTEDFVIEITAFWHDVTAPTLLYRGAESWTDDPVANGQAASLRDQRMVVIPRAGHWPHHDQFDLFVGSLLDFL